VLLRSGFAASGLVVVGFGVVWAKAGVVAAKAQIAIIETPERNARVESPCAFEKPITSSPRSPNW
jgi:hypothetical protein